VSGGGVTPCDICGICKWHAVCYQRAGHCNCHIQISCDHCGLYLSKLDPMLPYEEYLTQSKLYCRCCTRCRKISLDLYDDDNVEDQNNGFCRCPPERQTCNYCYGCFRQNVYG